MSAIELLRTIGRPIAFHPALAKLVGGVNAALFLSQMIYWDERAEDTELGTHKTVEQWELETGLSRKEQATARKHLRDRGLLIETHRRLIHRVYYKLNREAFNALFDGDVSTPGSDDEPTDNGQFANAQTGASRTPQRGFGEMPNQQPDIDPKGIPLIDTEITTETTKEKNTKKESSGFSFHEWPTTPTESVWADFEKHRKAKKAPLTQTAVDRMGRDACKAGKLGISVDQCLGECMARGWNSFKPEWLARDLPQGGAQQQGGKFNANEYLRQRQQQRGFGGGGDVIDV